jgi:glycosyltransferase involved in cell wall biosynthesis
LVIPPRDAHVLADATNQLLSHPDRRRAMGEAARQRALEFSVENMIERMLAIYESLI